MKGITLFPTPELDLYLCEECLGTRSEYKSTITYTFTLACASLVRSTPVQNALDAFRKSNRGFMLVDAGYMSTQDRVIYIFTKWQMVGSDE